MTPSQEVELAKMFEDLAKSHVEGNAPDAADFDTILRRDLTAYFAAKGVAEPSVEFEFLRQGATQSGVSYPKYYLWVRVLAKGASTRMAGAVRVAAIEKVRFDVTDFLSVEQVRSSPERVSQIFPAALAPSIISKAAAN